MDVISHTSSTLNTDALLFVPLAYRRVEDFSDDWWALVQSSPWFRDYWLQEHYHDSQFESDAFYDPSLHDDLDFFDDYVADDEVSQNIQPDEEGTKEYYNCRRELVSMGVMKWQNERCFGQAHTPKYMEKAPKFVNVKLSPRTIQQPT